MSKNITNTKGLLKIGQVADALEVSVPTIRKWCKEGLLKPITTKGGHRYFSSSEVFTMKKYNNETAKVQIESCQGDTFVNKIKQMRDDRQMSIKALLAELKSLEGNVSGVELSISSEVCEDTTSTKVPLEEWYFVNYQTDKTSQKVFGATFEDGDIFKFVSLPCQNTKNVSPFGPDGLAAVLGQVSRYMKLKNVCHGSFVDLMNALGQRIAMLP